MCIGRKHFYKCVHMFYWCQKQFIESSVQFFGKEISRAHEHVAGD